MKRKFLYIIEKELLKTLLTETYKFKQKIENKNKFIKLLKELKQNNYLIGFNCNYFKNLIKRYKPDYEFNSFFRNRLYYYLNNTTEIKPIQNRLFLSLITDNQNKLIEVKTIKTKTPLKSFNII